MAVKRFKFIVLMMLVLSLALSGTFVSAAVVFAETTPDSVPPYYNAVAGDPTIYEYKKNDGATYFRVHGTVDGAPESEGFFASDNAGELLEALPVLLDQLDELNNAYNSGTESGQAEWLVPNEAYISAFELQDLADGTPYMQAGGTPVWDGDDTAGNDRGPDNGIVRSFDSILYTLRYVTALQNQTQSTYFRQGYLYVKLVLPDVTTAQANFDVSSMLWLENPHLDTTGGDVTLTGRYHITADAGATAIPGEGELSVAVNVLGMMNGATIQPEFYAWMDGYVDDSTAVGNNKPKQVETDEVIVSAAPAFNIKLTRNTTLSFSLEDGFDFGTGNATAPNKALGVVNGRMYGYGVTLQLVNPDATKRLKGIELPSGLISFDLEMSVLSRTAGSDLETSVDITGKGTDEILPLLWEYEPNGGAAQWGRTIGWGNNTGHAYNVAPLNSGNKNAAEEYCANGGTWTATEEFIPATASEPARAVIHVTVDAYDLLRNGVYQWPKSDYTGGVAPQNRYGEDMGIAAFSAGYFNILFPDPTVMPVPETVTLNMVVEDSNLVAGTLSAPTPVAQTQKKTNDDSTNIDVVFNPPGSYDKFSYFTAGGQNTNPYNTNLSTGVTYDAGDAWAAPGSVVEIWGTTTYGRYMDIPKYAFACDMFPEV